MRSQGIHARSGVSCADCHMPYTREGALKISDHWVRSPLLNISRSCQVCHVYPESEIQARVDAIQSRTNMVMQRAATALTDMRTPYPPPGRPAHPQQRSPHCWSCNGRRSGVWTSWPRRIRWDFTRRPKPSASWPSRSTIPDRRRHRHAPIGRRVQLPVVTLRRTQIGRGFCRVGCVHYDPLQDDSRIDHPDLECVISHTIQGVRAADGPRIVTHRLQLEALLRSQSVFIRNASSSLEKRALFCARGSRWRLPQSRRRTTARQQTRRDRKR